jgi:hypothetical protein
MKSQNSSDTRRTLEAANCTSASQYKPLIVPLRGTYVAMIFRRSLKSRLEMTKS